MNIDQKPVPSISAKEVLHAGLTLVVAIIAAISVVGFLDCLF